MFSSPVFIVDTYEFTTGGRTQGGIFTTPGEAYTTPVEMWLKGLGKLHIFLWASEPNFLLPIIALPDLDALFLIQTNTIT